MNSQLDLQNATEEYQQHFPPFAPTFITYPQNNVIQQHDTEPPTPLEFNNVPEHLTQRSKFYLAMVNRIITEITTIAQTERFKGKSNDDMKDSDSSDDIDNSAHKTTSWQSTILRTKFPSTTRLSYPILYKFFISPYDYFMRTLAPSIIKNFVWYYHNIIYMNNLHIMRQLHNIRQYMMLLNDHKFNSVKLFRGFNQNQSIPTTIGFNCDTLDTDCNELKSNDEQHFVKSKLIMFNYNRLPVLNETITNKIASYHKKLHDAKTTAIYQKRKTAFNEDPALKEAFQHNLESLLSFQSSSYFYQTAVSKINKLVSVQLTLDSEHFAEFNTNLSTSHSTNQSLNLNHAAFAPQIGDVLYIWANKSQPSSTPPQYQTAQYIHTAEYIDSFLRSVNDSQMNISSTSNNTNNHQNGPLPPPPPPPRLPQQQQQQQSLPPPPLPSLPSTPPSFPGYADAHNANIGFNPFLQHNQIAQQGHHTDIHNFSNSSQMNYPQLPDNSSNGLGQVNTGLQQNNQHFQMSSNNNSNSTNHNPQSKNVFKGNNNNNNNNTTTNILHQNNNQSANQNSTASNLTRKSSQGKFTTTATHTATNIQSPSKLNPKRPVMRMSQIMETSLEDLPPLENQYQQNNGLVITTSSNNKNTYTTLTNSNNNGKNSNNNNKPTTQRTSGFSNVNKAKMATNTTTTTNKNNQLSKNRLSPTTTTTSKPTVTDLVSSSDDNDGYETDSDDDDYMPPPPSHPDYYKKRLSERRPISSSSSSSYSSESDDDMTSRGINGYNNYNSDDDEEDELRPTMISINPHHTPAVQRFVQSSQPTETPLPTPGLQLHLSSHTSTSSTQLSTQINNTMNDNDANTVVNNTNTNMNNKNNNNNNNNTDSYLEISSDEEAVGVVNSITHAATSHVPQLSSLSKSTNTNKKFITNQQVCDTFATFSEAIPKLSVASSSSAQPRRSVVSSGGINKRGFNHSLINTNNDNTNNNNTHFASPLFTQAKSIYSMYTPLPLAQHYASKPFHTLPYHEQLYYQQFVAPNGSTHLKCHTLFENDLSLTPFTMNAAWQNIRELLALPPGFENNKNSSSNNNSSSTNVNMHNKYTIEQLSCLLSTDKPLILPLPTNNNPLECIVDDVNGTSITVTCYMPFATALQWFYNIAPSTFEQMTPQDVTLLFDAYNNNTTDNINTVSNGISSQYSSEFYKTQKINKSDNFTHFLTKKKLITNISAEDNKWYISIPLRNMYTDVALPHHEMLIPFNVKTYNESIKTLNQLLSARYLGPNWLRQLVCNPYNINTNKDPYISIFGNQTWLWNMNDKQNDNTNKNNNLIHNDNLNFQERHIPSTEILKTFGIMQLLPDYCNIPNSITNSMNDSTISTAQQQNKKKKLSIEYSQLLNRIPITFGNQQTLPRVDNIDMQYLLPRSQFQQPINHTLCPLHECLVKSNDPNSGDNGNKCSHCSNVQTDIDYAVLFGIDEIYDKQSKTTETPSTNNSTSYSVPFDSYFDDIDTTVPQQTLKRKDASSVVKTKNNTLLSPGQAQKKSILLGNQTRSTQQSSAASTTILSTNATLGNDLVSTKRSRFSASSGDDEEENDPNLRLSKQQKLTLTKDVTSARRVGSTNGKDQTHDDFDSFVQLTRGTTNSNSDFSNGEDSNDDDDNNNNTPSKTSKSSIINPSIPPRPFAGKVQPQHKNIIHQTTHCNLSIHDGFHFPALRNIPFWAFTTSSRIALGNQLSVIGIAFINAQLQYHYCVPCDVVVSNSKSFYRHCQREEHQQAVATTIPLPVTAFGPSGCDPHTPPADQSQALSILKNTFPSQQGKLKSFKIPKTANNNNNNNNKASSALSSIPDNTGPGNDVFSTHLLPYACTVSSGDFIICDTADAASHANWYIANSDARKYIRQVMPYENTNGGNNNSTKRSSHNHYAILPQSSSSSSTQHVVCLPCQLRLQAGSVTDHLQTAPHLKKVAIYDNMILQSHPYHLIAPKLYILHFKIGTLRCILAMARGQTLPGDQLEFIASRDAVNAMRITKTKKATNSTNNTTTNTTNTTSFITPQHPTISSSTTTQQQQQQQQQHPKLTSSTTTKGNTNIDKTKQSTTLSTHTQKGKTQNKSKFETTSSSSDDESKQEQNHPVDPLAAYRLAKEKAQRALGSKNTSGKITTTTTTTTTTSTRQQQNNNLNKKDTKIKKDKDDGDAFYPQFALDPTLQSDDDGGDDDDRYGRPSRAQHQKLDRYRVFDPRKKRGPLPPPSALPAFPKDLSWLNNNNNNNKSDGVVNKIKNAILYFKQNQHLKNDNIYLRQNNRLMLQSDASQYQFGGFILALNATTPMTTTPHNNNTQFENNVPKQTKSSLLNPELISNLLQLHKSEAEVLSGQSQINKQKQQQLLTTDTNRFVDVISLIDSSDDDDEDVVISNGAGNNNSTPQNNNSLSNNNNQEEKEKQKIADEVKHFVLTKMFKTQQFDLPSVFVPMPTQDDMSQPFTLQHLQQHCVPILPVTSLTQQCDLFLSVLPQCGLLLPHTDDVMRVMLSQQVELKNLPLQISSQTTTTPVDNNTNNNTTDTPMIRPFSQVNTRYNDLFAAKTKIPILVQQQWSFSQQLKEQLVFTPHHLAILPSFLTRNMTLYHSNTTLPAILSAWVWSAGLGQPIYEQNNNNNNNNNNNTSSQHITHISRQYQGLGKSLIVTNNNYHLQSATRMLQLLPSTSLFLPFSTHVQSSPIIHIHTPVDEIAQRHCQKFVQYAVLDNIQVFDFVAWCDDAYKQPSARVINNCILSDYNGGNLTSNNTSNNVSNTDTHSNTNPNTQQTNTNNTINKKKKLQPRVIVPRHVPRFDNLYHSIPTHLYPGDLFPQAFASTPKVNKNTVKTHHISLLFLQIQNICTFYNINVSSFAQRIGTLQRNVVEFDALINDILMRIDEVSLRKIQKEIQQDLFKKSIYRQSLALVRDLGSEDGQVNITTFGTAEQLWYLQLYYLSPLQNVNNNNNDNTSKCSNIYTQLLNAIGLEESNIPLQYDTDNNNDKTTCNSNGIMYPTKYLYSLFTRLNEIDHSNSPYNTNVKTQGTKSTPKSQQSSPSPYNDEYYELQHIKDLSKQLFQPSTNNTSFMPNNQQNHYYPGYPSQHPQTTQAHDIYNISKQSAQNLPDLTMFQQFVLYPTNNFSKNTINNQAPTETQPPPSLYGCYDADHVNYLIKLITSVDAYTTENKNILNNVTTCSLPTLVNAKRSTLFLTTFVQLLKINFKHIIQVAINTLVQSCDIVIAHHNFVSSGVLNKAGNIYNNIQHLNAGMISEFEILPLLTLFTPIDRGLELQCDNILSTTYSPSNNTGPLTSGIVGSPSAPTARTVISDYMGMGDIGDNSLTNIKQLDVARLQKLILKPPSNGQGSNNINNNNNNDISKLIVQLQKNQHRFVLHHTTPHQNVGLLKSSLYYRFTTYINNNTNDTNNSSNFPALSTTSAPTITSITNPIIPPSIAHPQQLFLQPLQQEHTSNRGVVQYISALSIVHSIKSIPSSSLITNTGQSKVNTLVNDVSLQHQKMGEIYNYSKFHQYANKLSNVSTYAKYLHQLNMYGTQTNHHHSSSQQQSKQFNSKHAIMKQTPQHSIKLPFGIAWHTLYSPVSNNDNFILDNINKKNTNLIHNTINNSVPSEEVGLLPYLIANIDSTTLKSQRDITNAQAAHIFEFLLSFHNAQVRLLKNLVLEQDKIATNGNIQSILTSSNTQQSNTTLPSSDIDFNVDCNISIDINALCTTSKKNNAISPIHQTLVKQAYNQHINTSRPTMGMRLLFSNRSSRDTFLQALQTRVSVDKMERAIQASAIQHTSGSNNDCYAVHIAYPLVSAKWKLYTQKQKQLYDDYLQKKQQQIFSIKQEQFDMNDTNVETSDAPVTAINPSNNTNQNQTLFDDFTHVVSSTQNTTFASLLLLVDLPQDKMYRYLTSNPTTAVVAFQIKPQGDINIHNINTNNNINNITASHQVHYLQSPSTLLQSTSGNNQKQKQHFYDVTYIVDSRQVVHPRATATTNSTAQPTISSPTIDQTSCNVLATSSGSSANPADKDNNTNTDKLILSSIIHYAPPFSSFNINLSLHKDVDAHITAIKSNTTSDVKADIAQQNTIKKQEEEKPKKEEVNQQSVSSINHKQLNIPDISHASLIASTSTNFNVNKQYGNIKDNNKTTLLNLLSTTNPQLYHSIGLDDDVFIIGPSSTEYLTWLNTNVIPTSMQQQTAMTDKTTSTQNVTSALTTNSTPAKASSKNQKSKDNGKTLSASSLTTSVNSQGTLANQLSSISKTTIVTNSPANATQQTTTTSSATVSKITLPNESSSTDTTAAASLPKSKPTPQDLLLLINQLTEEERSVFMQQFLAGQNNNSK